VLRDPSGDQPLLAEDATGTEGPSVRAGAAVSLVARWGDGAAERYLRPAADGSAVEEASEVLEVQWSVAGGRFEQVHTGAVGALQEVRNTLRVDAARTQPVLVWVALRDDRGGVEVRSFRIPITGP
jgi:hypothetical protein